MHDGQWMEAGHMGWMILWWILILGGVFAAGFFMGRASGRDTAEHREPVDKT